MRDRVPPYLAGHDLYLRQTRDGLELSDLFATMHVDPDDLERLLFSLRRM